MTPFLWQIACVARFELIKPNICRDHSLSANADWLSTSMSSGNTLSAGFNLSEWVSRISTLQSRTQKQRDWFCKWPMSRPPVRRTNTLCRNTSQSNCRRGDACRCSTEEWPGNQGCIGKSSSCPRSLVSRNHTVTVRE